jgi:hypothetical protein
LTEHQRPPNFFAAMRHYVFSVLCCFASCFTAAAEAEALVDFDSPRELDKWAFELGVAVITKNSVAEMLSGNISRGDGPEGGEIYQLKATKTLDVLSWNIAGNTFRPHLELPLCLEIVDENGRDPFLDYNASVQLRWVDFPWNSTVQTSFAVGLGLSYSSKVYAMDVKQHLGEDRSHLKFNLPIELTFHLPGKNNEQLSLYLAHQSGGFGFFDVGGVNSLGIAFSRTF